MTFPGPRAYNRCFFASDVPPRKGRPLREPIRRLSLREEWMNRLGSWKRATRIALAATVIAVAHAPAANAQYYSFKPHAELTALGGAYFGGTVYTGSTAALRRDVNVNDDWAYGGRLAYVFSPAIGLEAGFIYSKADMNLSTGAGQGPAHLGELTESRYELNFNFYTNPGPVIGYFTLGGGLTHLVADIDRSLIGSGSNNSASDDRFSSNIGLGVKLNTSEKMGIRLDGRWRYMDTDVGGDQYYCDIYGFCYSYDNSYYGSGELTGGLTYSF